MSNELTTTLQFSAEDIALIKETVCKGATESEFKLFINQARTTGLNPLARQVFAVKRWNSALNREEMSIQVSIDGFRLIAERTGKYAGQVGPFWCGEDGKWVDVWVSDVPPAAAKIGTLRHDFKEPCWGVARFNSYAQRKKDGNLTTMWSKMSDVMIAKCAESLALRKAFPQELSGLYTSDEMEQATPVQEPQKAIEPPESKMPEGFKNLTEDAKEFAKEIEMSDSEKKLEATIKRFLATDLELIKKLPAWHSKLAAMIDHQRKSFGKQEAA